MRSSLLYVAISAALGIHCTHAFRPPLRRGIQLPPAIHGLVDSLVPDGTQSDHNSANAVAGSLVAGNGTFEQYIDHTRPEPGKFSQRFWWNATHWKGPKSPIIFVTPGEISADGYIGLMSDASLSGLIAKEVGGAAVMVEMRYFGDSKPFELYTTENLQYFTLEQIVCDFARIAHELQLPFDSTGSSNIPNSPWIYSGGSMAGALGIWTERFAPGTFFATHASSSSVQTIYNFWQYFLPIQEYMPQNCSSDFSAIIEHIDNTFESGTLQQQADLKAMFGLGSLEHNDDFASIISAPMFTWQNYDVSSGYTPFLQMCDTIEGFGPNTSTAGRHPSDHGIGLEKALANYADWFKENVLFNQCASQGVPEWSDPYNVECLNTYNASSPMFSVTVDNSFLRALWWLLCAFAQQDDQTGPPPGQPPLMSRLVTGEYYERQCDLFFAPEGEYTWDGRFGRGEAAAAKMNALTGGWDNVGMDRMFFVEGKRDPWRDAGFASEFRPGGPYQGTARNPLILMEDGHHCSDIFRKNGRVSREVNATQMAVIAQMGEWVKEFYAAK